MSEMTEEQGTLPGTTEGEGESEGQQEETTPVEATDFQCPECFMNGESRIFGSPQALGKHRQATHGISGTSREATQKRKRNRKAPTKRMVEELNFMKVMATVTPYGLMINDESLEMVEEFKRLAKSLHAKSLNLAETFSIRREGT